MTDELPQAATIKAVSFLKEWPGYPTLTAIHTDPSSGEKGLIETKAFPPDPATGVWAGLAVHTWIETRQGKANLYFLVNTSSVPKDNKANKGDISAMVALHVDVDCRVGEDQVEGIARIVKTFNEYKTKPSFITASGGGAQGFWLLDTPLLLDGSKEMAAEAERYNIQLERDLAGDHCGNIDRIMRLPGTINIPNESKRKKGRKAALAVLVVSHPDTKYEIGAFAKASADVAKPKENTFKAAPVISTDIGPVTFDSLLAIGVGQDILDIIANAPLEINGADGEVLKGGQIHFKVISALRRATLSTADIKAAYKLGKLANGPTASTRGFDGYIEKTIASADIKIGLVVPADNPMKLAEILIGSLRPNLKHYKEDFIDWISGRYESVAAGTISANIYSKLENCKKLMTVGKEKHLVEFNPKIQVVSETLAAMKAKSHVPPDIDQPCWLDGRTSPNPADLISFPNGILDLNTDILGSTDPMLFTPHAVAFPYNKDAGEPTNFKAFLAEAFNNEQDQIDSLQEAIGYSLSSDVSQEKAFMLLGDKRGGKDTIKNVLTGLLPSNAFIGPTLDSMGTNFGMSSFVGKMVAIIGDMHIGSKCDKDLLAENVLKLTGRSLFTMDRKNQSHWTGYLPCKLWMISNERPTLKDSSGALASRFIIYQTRTSWLGREDTNFFRDKLLPELPAILLWALQGLKRIRANNKITETKCSKDEREILARDASPVLSFVQEWLVLEPGAQIDKDEMHRAFCKWAEEAGTYPKSKSVFMRDLQSATGGKLVAGRAPETAGKRTPIIHGARFRRNTDARAATGEIPF